MNFRFRRDDVGQEEDEVVWPLMFSAFILLFALLATFIAFGWVMKKKVEADLRPSGDFSEARLGPRHEVAMVQQGLFDGESLGQKLFDEQRKELGKFGWRDQKNGIASIPVDDAIDIVVERGRK